MAIGDIIEVNDKMQSGYRYELVTLTGQDFDTFRKWQAWYNKNKNKKW